MAANSGFAGFTGHRQAGGNFCAIEGLTSYSITTYNRGFIGNYNLEIGTDKKSVNYIYYVNGKSTGITNLLKDLRDAGLKLQDLKTEQTTLEKIFVSLVKENNEI